MLQRPLALDMRVPQEIADAIIQYAEYEPTSLCNLCLVSSFFLPIAQQVLYREVRVVDREPARRFGSIDSTQFLGFLKTIVEYNNALAKHVQKLHLGLLTLTYQGLEVINNLKILSGGFPTDIGSPKRC